MRVLTAPSGRRCLLCRAARAATALLLGAGIVACASGGQRETAHNYLGGIARQVEKRLHADEVLGAAPLQLTFEDACLQVALADDALLAGLTRVRELEIDVAQSRSMLWPRAELRTFGEFAGGDQRSTDWIGGVYLQYNLSRVLFLSDEIAVAKARKARALEELRLRLREDTRRLHAQLITIHDLEGEVAARERMVTAAESALRLIENAAEGGRARLADLWRLRAEEASQAAQLAEARRGLEAQRRELALVLGRGSATQPAIGDVEAVLRPLPVDALPPIDELWSRRPDAHVAETDLFLAQMAHVAARRERLPRPTANLGLGNIPLSSRREEASWVVRLGVEMPLLDFGDVSRRIKKAQLNVDLARRRAANVIVRMAQEAQQTESDHRLAREQAEAAAALLEQMRQADAAGPTLIEQYRADPLEVLTQQIRLGETEIRAHRAEGALWKATAARRLAAGEPLLPDVEERLLEALLNRKESIP